MGYYYTLVVVVPDNEDGDKECIATAEAKLYAVFNRYHHGYTLTKTTLGGGCITTFTVEFVKWLSTDLRDELDDVDWPAGTGVWVVGEQGDDYTVKVFCGPRRQIVATPGKLAVWDPFTREALIDGAYGWMNDPPSLTIQDPPSIAPDRAAQAVDLLRAIRQQMVDQDRPAVGDGRDWLQQHDLLDDVVEVLRPIARATDTNVD